MEDKNPLVFRYADIKAEGGRNVRFSPDPAVFAEAFDRPGTLRKLDLELDFSVGGDSILLEGRASAELGLECSRCAEPVVRAFEDTFDEVYPDTVEYIDTREVIRETVGLLAPMKVLCSEDCKGRCPVCGADRNSKACGCRPEKAGPFDALKDFKPGGPGGKDRI